MSLPARERGLKPDSAAIHIAGALVAPRTGAWIETLALINGGKYSSFQEEGNWKDDS